MNAALKTIPTGTIPDTTKADTQCSKTFEMLGYKMGTDRNKQYQPWMRRLETKIKANMRAAERENGE